MHPGAQPDTTVEDTAETERKSERAAELERPSGPSQSRLARGFFIASILVAVLPVAVATTRAIYTGWIPTEDNALFSIRSRDLFTYTHLPLIGTWSSASLDVRSLVNHPGPLYFDLLAVPARLSGSGAGVAFGVAVVNTLCIVGIAVFAYRRGGALAGTVAMAATAGMCWSMGSELLFEPWNPHSAMLPFLFFLVLVWSMTSGDLVALPFGAFVGSLVVQTHLSYALLVPILGAWGIVGLLLFIRAERRRDSGAWPERRTRVLRFGAAGTAVLIVCWLQPLIEQFTSSGSGNLTRLVDTARSQAGTIGYGFGARVVATVVALPPWFFRPSLKEKFLSGWQAPSLGLALFSLGLLAAVLVACGWDARRRRDRPFLWCIATAGAGLAAALLTAGRGPVTVFGKVTPHTFRWLWPLGAFVFFAVAATVGRRLTRRAATSVRSVALVGGFALVTLVLAAINLPYANEGRGPNSQEYAIPAARDLGSHMGSLEGRGPLLVDDLYHRGFAEPYGGAVVAELQRRGIPFVVRDPQLVRQFGPARRFNGHNANAALLLRQGDATLEAPAESRRVADGEGVPATEVRELARLKTQIGEFIGQRGLPLNARGQTALDEGKLPTLARSADQGLDVAALVATRELDVMIRGGYLKLDDAWAKRFRRYADLQNQWDQKTVALFVGPVSAASRPRE